MDEQTIFDGKVITAGQDALVSLFAAIESAAPAITFAAWIAVIGLTGLFVTQMVVLGSRIWKQQ